MKADRTFNLGNLLTPANYNYDDMHHSYIDKDYSFGFHCPNCDKTVIDDNRAPIISMNNYIRVHFCDECGYEGEPYFKLENENKVPNADSIGLLNINTFVFKITPIRIF